MSRTTTLSEILSVLDTFIEREGHACVPATQIERGIRLGDAIDHVRTLHATGVLPDKAAAALQSRAGWSWDRGNTTNHSLIAAVGEHIAHHGHAVFAEASDLAAAAAAVRAELADGVIDRGLFDSLQSFPEWSWEDVYDYGWGDRYRELLAFEQSHGHLRIPERVNGSSRLCQWASWQRSRYFKGDLPTSRRHRLEMVEHWEWRPERAIRHRYVTELQKYVDVHGTATLPNSYVTAEGYKLGAALAKARVDHESGRLAAGTVRALESVPGWSWEKVRAPGQVRQEAVDALTSFVEREGHGNVPATHVELGLKLGTYLTQARCSLRKGRLGASQKDALDHISRDWRRGSVGPDENGSDQHNYSGRIAA